MKIIVLKRRKTRQSIGFPGSVRCFFKIWSYEFKPMFPAIEGGFSTRETTREVPVAI